MTSDGVPPPPSPPPWCSWSPSAVAASWAACPHRCWEAGYELPCEGSLDLGLLRPCYRLTLGRRRVMRYTR